LFVIITRHLPRHPLSGIATMQLSTAIIFTLAASHLSNAFLHRDDGQDSVSSPPSKLLISRQDNVAPLPQNEVCLYLTNSLNWGGDGQNLCGQTGICSELHNPQEQDSSLTNTPLLRR
jgi:hypothetical protein